MCSMRLFRKDEVSITPIKQKVNPSQIRAPKIGSLYEKFSNGTARVIDKSGFFTEQDANMNITNRGYVGKR